MKRLVIGILAHVDSGKTTLSESMLYLSGQIRRQGRVDHKDAFLDTDTIERDRGITIFSHQAVMNYNGMAVTLLDTPGHVDFSAEMERTLSVLDYAILVISGSEGVQSHTETLWKLLEHYSIPTFIFVNKMDLVNADKERVLNEIRTRLSEGCVEFGSDSFFEEAAMTDERLLEEYSNTEKVTDEGICDAIASRKLFLCCFGSALKNEGVEEFLKIISKYTKSPEYSDTFGAKIFKISEDERARRLTYMKITGGSLKVKSLINHKGKEEKINEIRIYSGAKYTNTDVCESGGVCAVVGLNGVYAGDGMGFETGTGETVLDSVFSYSVRLSEGEDLHNAIAVFKKLEEEETTLHVEWDERNQKINVRMMGEVQKEVLKRILAERFSINADFENGTVLYKETVKNAVEGVGHYEPLRHYAEVHLVIEPGKRGSGLVFASKCSEDFLDKNWQRLIMTHLSEKVHKGVLTGSPITDMKITLVSGRAHQKHTEGGDFRQATYRAVRHALMMAESQLLEPWYSFRLEIPMENTGRAMTDLERMGAKFESPETVGDICTISGSSPVVKICEYHKEVIAYSKGRGRLMCTLKGYEACTNSEEVIEKIGYDPLSDVENTPDSVFCSHGSGFNVKWSDVYDYMHLPLTIEDEEAIEEAAAVREYRPIAASDDELLRIFERTYGKVEQKAYKAMRKVSETSDVKHHKAKPLPKGPEYLLIDGYNIIFAWDELKKAAENSLEEARKLLIDRVCNYRAVKKNNVILVFDAYKVKGVVREVEKIRGISVVYTKEAETADAYIEKTTKELCKEYRVRVATSDNLEQVIIFGHGARRVPASEFYEEVVNAEKEIREFIKNNNEENKKKMLIADRELVSGKLNE